MKAALQAVLAACVLAAGCALLPTGMLTSDTPGVMRAGAPPPAAARSLVRPGSSTREEVAAALGPATVVTFDSGWQLWVYRWPGAGLSMRAATELVVLFDASGVARKARVRAASGAVPAGGA